MPRLDWLRADRAPGMAPMIFWLPNFPMPPTQNRYLQPARGSRGMCKTPEARLFHAQYLDYARKTNAHLKTVAVLAQTAVTRGFQLRVDCFFVFENEKLFTKKNEPKVIDANNRLKFALDGVAHCLGVDDKHFFAGNCEKVSTLDSTNKNFVMIRVETMRPRGIGDVLRLMGTDAMLKPPEALKLNG